MSCYPGGRRCQFVTSIINKVEFLFLTLVNMKPSPARVSSVFTHMVKCPSPRSGRVLCNKYFVISSFDSADGAGTLRPSFPEIFKETSL